MKFVIKSKKVMRDYIALNWLEPRESEIFGIKYGEIFIRRDWWENPAKKLRVKVHEKTEIYLRRNFKLTYEQAHHIATLVEHQVIKNKGWKLDEPIIHKE